MIEIPPGGIEKILDANKDKNFVDRILNKDNYPSIDNGDGTSSTHKMAWGEADGKYFVYPTIVQDKDTKELKQLDPDAAFRYAMNNKEFVEFDNPEDAEQFSTEYKSVWNKPQEQPKDFYTLAESYYQKPQYDQKSADQMRKMAKIAAISEGFRGLSDIVTSASNGNVERRPADTTGPWAFQNIQALNADYKSRKDAYNQNIASLRIAKQKAEDDKAWKQEQMGLYRDQLKLQQDKADAADEYNRLRMELDRDKLELDKAWKEYQKTKDARQLQALWANIGLKQQALEVAKNKAGMTTGGSSTAGWDPLMAPSVPSNINSPEEEMGYMLQYLKGQGLNQRDYLYSAFDMLTNQYGVSQEDAIDIINNF